MGVGKKKSSEDESPPVEYLAPVLSALELIQWELKNLRNDVNTLSFAPSPSASAPTPEPSEMGEESAHGDNLDQSNAEGRVASAEGETATASSREAEAALSESLKAVQEQLAASEQRCEQLGTELEASSHKIDELTNELQKERASVAVLNSDAEVAQENFQKLTQTNQEQIQEISELKQTAADQFTHLTRLNEANSAREENIRQVTEQSEHLGAELSQTQGELQSAQSEVVSLQRAAGFDQKLGEIIWPKFLAEEKFEQWRTALTDGIFSEPPTPTVVSLVTCLFSYSALSRVAEPDSKRIVDVVFDLGSSLYAWCHESSLDREASYTNALLWADAINAENLEVLSILVPEPDTPFDRKTMVSYSGESGVSPDVGDAKSWCIKDADGRIQRQATVTLT